MHKTPSNCTEKSTVSTGINAARLLASEFAPCIQILPMPQKYAVYADPPDAYQARWLEKNWRMFTFTASEIVRFSLPISSDFPNISGVYFLIRAGIIVYVGMSCQVATRIAAHRKDRLDIERAWCMYGFAELMLRDVEALYIAALRPSDNIHMKGCPGSLKQAFRTLRQQH